MWRARTGTAAREGPIRTSAEIPNSAATAAWIASTGSASPARLVLGTSFSTSSVLSGSAVIDEWAMTCVSAPCRRRTLVSIRAGELGQGVAAPRLEAGLAGQAPQNREPGRQVGVADRDGQAPLEAIAQPLGEGREFARQAVGGEDELAAAFIEGVEGVEELLLGGLLALEELDVVDEEDVEVAVPFLEPLGAAASAAPRRTRW